MRVFLAQLNPMIADLRGNVRKICHAIDLGRRQGAQLIVFPEMAVLGYPPEDFLLLPHFLDEVEKVVDEVVDASQDVAVLLGTVRRNESSMGKALYNTAAVIDDGKLLGFQDKALLPTYDVFDEVRYFEPANTSRVWKLAGCSVAVTICEDIWQHSGAVPQVRYPRDPVAEVVAHHPQLLVNLSASPYHVGKPERRLELLKPVVRTLGCPAVLCNQVGGNDSLIFDGNSLVLNREGQLLVHGAGFEEDFVFCDLDADISPVPLKTDAVRDLHDALVLGIRDYFRKQGFTKACLGLSGGIDSAVVACLAAEALGPKNVLALVMPSRYSSKGSWTEAEQLINCLGIASQELSIEGPFQEFLDLLKPHFEGKPVDATEENLQSRIRGMIQMAFSNKHGYIVLATGNKSELAMGYATLYGDMCGGLGVISDVTKEEVYLLARWMNRNGVVIPEHTISKAPSAELRPDQRDTDSLPPYTIVDTVLEAYVEQHMSSHDIAAKYELEQEVVEQLVQRIHQNEYKRRQAPPGLRVSPKSFTVGRRFPIVQGWVK